MRKIQIINFDENKTIIDDVYFDKFEVKRNYKNIVIQIFIFFKKIEIHLFIFLPFALCYYFYFLSLESCNDGEGPCSTYIDWIKKKVIQEIISCVLLFIMIQIIILKKISKYHLIHIILVFFFFYYYRHGIDFVDHGYFNFYFYFILVNIFILLMIPLDIMIFCLKKYNKVKLAFIYLVSIGFFMIISHFYLFELKSSCSDWTKGLNNTYLENNYSRHGCLIQIPKQCTYKIFKYVQDYSKIRGFDCNKYNNNKLKENLFRFSSSPYMNKTSKRIGFPLTNKDPICFKDATKDNFIYKYVSDNLVDIDNKEILDKYFKDKMPEIIIDFSDNDKGKLTVDVKFNKTLSDERKLLENNSEPYSDNILLLYIDSLSRANAIRQLKKTMEFFEKFIPFKGGYNKKYPSEIFHSFQFFKYHSFDGYTFVNYPFFFYGQTKHNKNKHLITKFLKKNGYVTCNVHDYCDIENTRTYHNLSEDEIFDHQFVSCDPNNYGISVNMIRCLYDKQDIEHFLNYIEQFWRKYKNNRKYASLLTNHGHEGTLNVIKYQDSLIADFLNRLFDDNLLKDTAIIFLSDHGVGMPSIYYIYDFYKTEICLPSLFIIINDRKNISYENQYGYIQQNQQIFITAFDIYNTIGNLIYGDKYDNIPNKTFEMDSFKSNLGISLFNRINSKERFPDKYYNYSSLNRRVCERVVDNDR